MYIVRLLIVEQKVGLKPHLFYCMQIFQAVHEVVQLFIITTPFPFEKVGLASCMYILATVVIIRMQFDYIYICFPAFSHRV